MPDVPHDRRPSAAARAALRTQMHGALSNDPALEDLLDRVGWPDPPARKPGFAALLAIIVNQQISVHAAAGIRARIKAACARRVSAAAILRLNDEQLRACGLSRGKAAYARALAEAVHTRRLRLPELERMDTEAVIEKLCQLHGFGRWSAEIYALSALGHADVFPAGDLALRSALGHYLRLKTRPNITEARHLSQRWHPHRSAVALLLWRYYRQGGRL